MTGRTPRVDHYSMAYPASTAVMADARQGFTAWLRGWIDDDEVVDDLTLVLSELLANALRAGSSAADTVEVHAHAEPHDVVLEVRNPTQRWVEAEQRWDLADPLRPGGRGLLIVESLVDELAIEQDGDGTTTVRSRRSLDHR